jgi:hypothetical protein
MIEGFEYSDAIAVCCPADASLGTIPDAIKLRVIVAREGGLVEQTHTLEYGSAATYGDICMARDGASHNLPANSLPNQLRNSNHLLLLQSPPHKLKTNMRAIVHFWVICNHGHQYFYPQRIESGRVHLQSS